MLQNDEMSEEELIRLMSALGSDGIEGGCDDNTDADIIPMMQGMMKSLLSKDVLYPSLKDISAQVLELSVCIMHLYRLDYIADCCYVFR